MQGERQNVDFSVAEKNDVVKLTTLFSVTPMKGWNAKSELFFPVIPEAVIIHSHKRIFFRQSNDSFFHLCKVLSRQKPSHNEEEPEEMGIIHRAILAADQQRLFFLVEGRLLLKETVINAASMRAQIADDRHAVHILPQNFWAAIHGKPEPMGNRFFERTFGDGI